jgi:hypothetical protein
VSIYDATQELPLRFVENKDFRLKYEEVIFSWMSQSSPQEQSNVKGVPIMSVDGTD